MSEDLQLQVVKLIDKEVENTRRVNWGGFGVALYHGEIALQLRAQKITSQLIVPKTSDQIAAAEKALAAVKKERNDLVEERKTKYTARFLSVTKRLMKPEDSIEDAIRTNEAAILKAKQEKKAEDKLAEDKEKELKGVAEHVRVYVANMHAAYLKAQAKLIADAYAHALTAAMSVDQIPAYIKKVSERINKDNHKTPPPKPPFKYNTQDAIDSEVVKWFNPWTPQQYIDGFAIDIQNKFDDWGLALKNPEQAATLNKEELSVTVDAIEVLTDKETVAAKLEAIAMPLTVEPAGKELKEVYKIAEPQTMDEAFAIINAFTINKRECVPQLNKIKPINLSVKQMIGALEDLKNKDENFSVTGITFIKTEKL